MWGILKGFGADADNFSFSASVMVIHFI